MTEAHSMRVSGEERQYQDGASSRGRRRPERVTIYFIRKGGMRYKFRVLIGTRPCRAEISGSSGIP